VLDAYPVRRYRQTRRLPHPNAGSVAFASVFGNCFFGQNTSLATPENRPKKAVKDAVWNGSVPKRYHRLQTIFDFAMKDNFRFCSHAP